MDQPTELLSKVFHVQTIVLLYVCGYVLLLSYTWGFGFVPIIQINALPFMLLVVPLIMAGLLFLFLLFYLPVVLIRNRALLSEAMLYGPYDSEHKATGDEKRLLNLSFIPLCKEVIRRRGRQEGLIFVGFLLAFMGLWPWFLLSSMNEVTGNPFVSLFFYAIGIVLIVLFLKALYAGTAASRGIWYTVFLLAFIAFGCIDVRLGEIDFVPNTMVRLALQSTAMGGGIPITIIPSEADDGVALKGALVLFDGHTAWYQPCSAMETIEIVLDVKSIRFSGHNKCQG